MELKNKRLGHCMAALTGVLSPLGFSPFNVWPVLLLCSGCLFLLVHKSDVRTAVLRGGLYGIGLFGAGTSWVYVSIHQFGSAPVPLAALLTVLFTLLLTAVFILPLFFAYCRLRDRFNIHTVLRQALLFSAIWVLMEWVRSWFLTGFPWLLTGYGLLDTPFRGLGPVTGVYGLSLLMVLSSCLVVSMVIERQRLRRGHAVAVVIAVAGWGSGLLLNAVAWTTPTGTLTFSAVQGNIPQSLKWEPGYLEKTIQTYSDLTRSEWGQDLVIWPENALPVFYSRISSLMEQIDREASHSGSTFITGLPVDDSSVGELRYYNAIVAAGLGDGQYYKQKLVPFGEYVPFESLLRGLIRFFDLPMSAFSKGSGNQGLLELADTEIAPYICYEVVYPDFVAKQARDSGLLVTISNDTWFGRSIGPLQHYQIARMRALETGRYMIRATNDGKTALIDEKGNTVDSIARFQKGVLRGELPIMKGSTPFMILGSFPVLVICLLMIGFVIRKPNQ